MNCELSNESFVDLNGVSFTNCSVKSADAKSGALYLSFMDIPLALSVLNTSFISCSISDEYSQSSTEMNLQIDSSVNIRGFFFIDQWKGTLSEDDYYTEHEKFWVTGYFTDNSTLYLNQSLYDFLFHPASSIAYSILTSPLIVAAIIISIFLIGWFLFFLSLLILHISKSHRVKHRNTDVQQSQLSSPLIVPLQPLPNPSPGSKEGGIEEMRRPHFPLNVSYNDLQDMNTIDTELENSDDESDESTLPECTSSVPTRLTHPSDLHPTTRTDPYSSEMHYSFFLSDFLLSSALPDAPILLDWIPSPMEL